jgi:hypothetical protein
VRVEDNHPQGASFVIELNGLPSGEPVVAPVADVEMSDSAPALKS